MLLYFVVRVIPVKSGHGHFGQNQNKKIISRLKIVYINNIYYLYILSLELFSHQKTNLTEMTMTEFDRIFVVTKELHYFINHKKSLFMYFTYTQQLTALFLAIFDLFCLTSHHGFEQTAEKCIIFAEEKQHSAI